MKRRSTKQRELVYKAACRLYHPTSEQIWNAIRETHPTVGRATVFRNVTVLCEEGRLRKIYLSGDVTRYDANPDDHNHFICEKCGKIIDIPVTEAPELPKGLPLYITHQSVNYYGLCEACQKQKNQT